ncbi:MAG: hypothetical protein KF770_09415 [Anaerolineae bacterium]|nr:hypothetical protein [Anaerolineae bacterium]
MMKTLFSGSVDIFMQGPRVLSISEVVSNFVECNHIGFEEQVRILDFRRESLQVIRHALKTGDGSLFRQTFAQPAHAVIEKFPDDQFRIMLYDTRSSEPEHVLWLAVGLDENFPVYDYLFYEIVPYEGEQFAVLACYHRPPYGREVLDFDEKWSNVYEDETHTLPEGDVPFYISHLY